MTKRNKFILAFILAAILGASLGYWLRLQTKSDLKSTSKEASPPPSHVINTETLKIDGKRVLGLTPGKEAEEIKTLNVANNPSPNWTPALLKTLQKQGGKSIKDIQIRPVDSFILAQDNLALFVESVVVTITNEQNTQTTFRVLVDSQTGKILRNWDQPVIDPVNPRQNFRLKIDPRYQD